MMAYKQKSAVSRLDRLAIRLIGSPVNTGFTGPHMTIAINALLLICGLTGMVGTMMGQSLYKLILFTTIASVLHKAAMEFRERGYARRDEREDAIHWKAWAIGAAIPGIILVSWMHLLDAFADYGMWYPTQPDDWSAVSMFAMGLALQLSSIAKGCMTPAYAADLLDGE